MSERMTEEAVRVAIEEAGVAEPVFDQVHVARTADIVPPVRHRAAHANLARIIQHGAIHRQG